MKVRMVMCSKCEYDSGRLDCQACYVCDNGSNFKEKILPFDLSLPRNIIAVEAMKVLLTQGNLFRNSPVILSNQAFSIADAMIEKGTTHE